MGRHFLATKSGRGYLEWAPNPVGTNRSSARREVPEDFTTLIANPRWELLGGPCARCGDYFLKHTKRQKVYCSRNCSSAATAAPAMKRMRQVEQSRKTRSAQQCILEWGKTKRRLEWKEWVSNELDSRFAGSLELSIGKLYARRKSKRNQQIRLGLIVPNRIDRARLTIVLSTSIAGRRAALPYRFRLCVRDNPQLVSPPSISPTLCAHQLRQGMQYERYVLDRVGTRNPGPHWIALESQLSLPRQNE